jgi:hypothetical protein
MTQAGRVPDFPSLIRQLVAKTSAESVAVRFEVSLRTIHYWCAGKSLPPLTRVDEVATHLKRSPSYVRQAILNAQRRDDGRRKKG